MKLAVTLFIIGLNFMLFAHDGHHHIVNIASTELGQNLIGALAPPGQPTTWFDWLGNLHLVFLHFPIALINILVLSELLLVWTKDKFYDDASRFILHCAAILTPITAVLGLIHSYSTSYEGMMEIYLMAHMSLGIATTVFVITLVFIRDRLGKTFLYYVCLTLLFVLVNLTGYFGGEMTFGPNNTMPPLSF